MVGHDQPGNPKQLEDPDQPADLTDPVEPELAEPSEPVEAEALSPRVHRQPKIPTAVTLVVVIGMIAAVIYLTRGVMAAWVVWKCDVLTRLADRAPSALTLPMACGTEATLINPPELLANAVVGIGVGAIMAIILVSFVRLRSWAWTALMLWGGFVLARDLFQYFVYPDERPDVYLGMLFSALIVLALNQEDVQTAFGIKREAHGLLPPTNAG